MKRLKLFPKIFIYTLFLMLMIALLASGMFYLLAPIIASDNPLTPGTAGNIFLAEVPRNASYSWLITIHNGYVCAYFFNICFLFFKGNYKTD